MTMIVADAPCFPPSLLARSSPYPSADFPQPRAPGLYSQPNHSSPSFPFHLGSFTADPTSLDSTPPVIPSMDDINLGLENMHFSQQPNSGGSSAPGQHQSHAGAFPGS